jgi:hypothetical protein
MAYVAGLGKDFTRFKTDFEVIGTHLGHAQKKFGDADKQLDRLGSALLSASDDSTIELAEPEPIRVIEAA